MRYVGSANLRVGNTTAMSIGGPANGWLYDGRISMSIATEPRAARDGLHSSVLNGAHIAPIRYGWHFFCNVPTLCVPYVARKLMLILLKGLPQFYEPMLRLGFAELKTPCNIHSLPLRGWFVASPRLVRLL